MSEQEGKQSAFTTEFIEAKKAEKRSLKRLTTVMCDDEEQYAHFLEWVWDEFGGPKGLAFTNSALPMSIRLYPGLLELAQDKFPMRPIRAGEEKAYLESLPGTRPFDPADLKGRHVPGVGFFRNNRRA